MGSGEPTYTGGGKRSFDTTSWTLLDRVGQDDSEACEILIDDLLGRYWKPVYCYLRCKGYGNEDAKDRTQGFFAEIVLGRDLIGQADRKRGKFRTFLLTALDRYLISVHRKQSALKRMPRDKRKAMELKDIPDVSTPGPMTSEESFNYTWVTELLDRIIADVREQCVQSGMEQHWNIFADRVLRPIIEDSKAPSMEELCRRYDVDKPVKASNMIASVKRRFQAALGKHLRMSVTSEGQTSEEMQELMCFLAKKAQ